MPELGNAILQGFEIEVNGVDVTAAADGALWCSLTHPKISEDGLFPCTGTLTLQPVEGFAANFFDPRKNRGQWRRGVSVRVSTQKPGQALEPQFTGYILKRPATPAELGGALVISIGDELAYRDNDEPAEDRAGITLGSSGSRTNIINRISADWGGAWLGTIPEFSIDYPLPKYQGSFVQQAGAIAASAGYGLYCDRFGDLKAAKFDLSPPALFSRTFANTFLVAQDGSDEPAATVNAFVSGREVNPTERETCDITEDQGALLTGNGQVGDFTRKRTTVKRRWSSNYKSLTQTTEVEVPEINADTSRVRLITRTFETEVRRYASSKDGKLESISKAVQTGALFAGLGTSGLIQTSRELTEYAYDGDVPLSVSKETYGLAISINGNTGQTTTQETFLGSERTEWEELSGDYWRRTETTYTPFVTNDGRVQDIGNSESFYGRQYRPGEPERHVPTHSSDPIEYEGSAQFGGIADKDDEPALFEFEYGVSRTQANMLAALHGAILNGRDAGWNCSLELLSEWNAWTPASAVQITLPDGDIGLFLTDGVVRSFSNAAATVSFGCVELGTLGTESVAIAPGQILSSATPVTPTPPTVTELIPPYQVVISGEHGLAFGFEGSVSQELLPEPQESEHGFTFGFEGSIPFGAAGEHGFTYGLEDLSATPSTPLAIAAGGTGGITAFQARQNLGLSNAGGDLDGQYPSPVIRSEAVTYSKIQNVSAARLLGNSQTTDGPVEEIEIGDNLTLTGGVLSATGTGAGTGAGTGTTEHREEIEVTTDQAFVEFTGIPADYDTIKIWVLARTGRADSIDVLNVYLNEDTSDGSYQLQTLDAQAAGSFPAGATGPSVVLTTADTSPTGAMGTALVEIPFYTETGVFTNIRANSVMNRSAGVERIGDRAATWMNTAPVNSVRLSALFGPIKAGSRFILTATNGGSSGVSGGSGGLVMETLIDVFLDQAFSLGTGLTTVPFQGVNANEGSIYDTVTGQFSPPETGEYFALFQLRMDFGVPSARYNMLLYNVTDAEALMLSEYTGGEFQTTGTSKKITLDSAKVYAIAVSSTASNQPLRPGEATTFFQLHRISNAAANPSARIVAYDDATSPALPSEFTNNAAGSGGIVNFDSDRLERFGTVSDLNIHSPDFLGEQSVSGAARFTFSGSETAALLILRNVTLSTEVARIVWNGGNLFYQTAGGAPQGIQANNIEDGLAAIFEVVQMTATKCVVTVRWSDSRPDYREEVSVNAAGYNPGDTLRFVLQGNARYSNFAVYRGDYRLIF